ncbi:unnamed protein product [Triticum turgidum subsp. durum]|uniref:Auxin efflux carrier component n=1 Tax=Triticum turgidum subsp. durum TaxID=4567 RepID=A0A9R1AN23_TRITD|nr:unnamed protein product [Triticum turgidum subsp. durum]
MGLLELFITACMPVLNMLLVTGVGSFLATDSAGILGKEARKHLNYVVFYVFNPALIATYLGKTITMESLAKLWFMPVNVFFTFILGLIFGWIVIKVTGAPLMLRGLILGCCSAGNLGNIFLIIIPALCKEKGSPFGAPDVCQTYGLAYSSLSLAIGAVFLWMGVYNIIRANSNVTEGHGSSPIIQTKVLVSGGTGCADSEDNHSISSGRVDECALPLISNKTKTKVFIAAGTFFFSAQVLVPHYSLPPSPPNHHTLTQHSNNYPPVPLLERAKGFVSSVSGAVDLKKLFAPSTIGVIIGFIIVGGTPLIRNALIGDDAPLRVLRESGELIGGAAVPSVTLIMGGNLITGTITQLFGVGESECSVIFVWVYALASVAVTMWSAFFMWTLS